MEALFADISITDIIIIILLAVIVVQLRSIGDNGSNNPPSIGDNGSNNPPNLGGG